MSVALHTHEEPLPQSDALEVVTAAALGFEVAALEQIVALVRRRQELHKELADLGLSPGAHLLNMTQTIRVIADLRGVSVEDICGEDRHSAIVAVRQEAMWVLRNQRKPDGHYRWSLPQIGRAMGDRDHTTIMHGVQRHQERLQQAPA